MSNIYINEDYLQLDLPIAITNAHEREHPQCNRTLCGVVESIYKYCWRVHITKHVDMAPTYWTAKYSLYFFQFQFPKKNIKYLT